MAQYYGVTDSERGSGCGSEWARPEGSTHSVEQEQEISKNEYDDFSKRNMIII